MMTDLSAPDNPPMRIDTMLDPPAGSKYAVDRSPADTGRAPNSARISSNDSRFFRLLCSVKKSMQTGL